MAAARSENASSCPVKYDIPVLKQLAAAHELCEKEDIHKNCYYFFYESGPIVVDDVGQALDNLTLTSPLPPR